MCDTYCCSAESSLHDGRAPLTCGFEEAAVTLYPVNSDDIVLERGC